MRDSFLETTEVEEEEEEEEEGEDSPSNQQDRTNDYVKVVNFISMQALDMNTIFSCID